MTDAPDAPYTVFLSEDERITSDGVLPEYVGLYRRNDDLSGWLRFPGSTKYPIDYPILWSGDNDYYLRRDFTKRFSMIGVPFFDGARLEDVAHGEVLLADALQAGAFDDGRPADAGFFPTQQDLVELVGVIENEHDHEHEGLQG